MGEKAIIQIDKALPVTPFWIGALMKHLGTILICGSSLFFIETAFEMYVLTALKGPQLIGFSLAHIFPFVLFLVFLSAFCYFALAIFALTVVVLEKLGKGFVAKEYSNRMLVQYLGGTSFLRKLGTLPFPERFVPQFFLESVQASGGT